MKKASRSLKVLVLALALASATARAEQGAAAPEKPARDYDRFSIKLNLWAASYNGEVEVADQDIFGGTATIKGDRLNLAHELGLTNPQTVPEVVAWVRLGVHHRILASYFYANYEGSKRLTQDVSIGGLTFQMSSDLGTTFEFSRVVLMHQWSPLLNERGRLGLQYGLQYYSWRFKYSGREVNTGLKESDEAVLPILIPVIGLDGNLALAYGIGLYGSFSGVGIGLAGIQASYTDLELGISYDYKMLHAAAGYRTIDTRLKGEDEDDQTFESNFSHSGWLFSIGVNL